MTAAPQTQWGDPIAMEHIPLIRGSDDFESFFRTEYRAVLCLAIALSGNAAAAEDLTQDAFLAALRQWDRVGTYGNPGAWVRRVVANQSVSRFRRSLAEARAILRLGSSQAAITIAPGATSVDIWREVRRLPRRQAQVIALTYLDDLPRTEVAWILGCSEETVKTHLARGRARLAGRLDDYSFGA